jgi:hypothetical protein
MDRRRAAGLGLIETFLVKRVVGDEAQNLVGGEAERLQYQNGPAALPVDGWSQEGKRGPPIASVGDTLWRVVSIIGPLPRSQDKDLRRL